MLIRAEAVWNMGNLSKTVFRIDMPRHGVVRRNMKPHGARLYSRQAGAEKRLADPPAPALHIHG